MEADALWAWKSFLRGLNPILYDLGIAAGFDPLDPALEPARLALGDTRRLAEQLDLARTEPQGHLASSGFALCRPDHDYVALRPAGDGGPLSLDVPPGTYAVRWIDIDDRIDHAGDDLVADGPAATVLTCPFADDHSGVVHLSRRG